MVIFADMDHSDAIENRATRARVHTVFGLEGLVETLVEIGKHGDVFYPPTAEELEREAELIMPGAGQAGTPAGLDLHLRQVVTHADVVNVYTTPEGPVR